ncbi:MAG: beta-galactosidase [Eubacteriales bacterium]|nr:beta-galactosidase [Eubacteriales bacterium]
MHTNKYQFPAKLLHGGDYNPDQWLNMPEILEEDLKLMKEAHVNCVTLGVFSWSRLEPEEGVYRMDYMENIINRLYENGIYTILATPTGAMPHWLTDNYEEVNRMSDMGIRTEEIDIQPEGVNNHIVYHGEKYPIRDICAIVHQENADVLATYEKDFYKGYPAATCNSYGKGKAYFVAAEGDEEFICRLYQEILDELPIPRFTAGKLPKNVLVSGREGDEETLYFLQNFGEAEVCIPLEHRMSDIETGECLEEKVLMKGYQCRILAEPKND